jgi:hypothetical protein
VFGVIHPFTHEIDFLFPMIIRLNYMRFPIIHRFVVIIILLLHLPQSGNLTTGMLVARQSLAALFWNIRGY